MITKSLIAFMGLHVAFVIMVIFGRWIGGVEYVSWGAFIELLPVAPVVTLDGFSITTLHTYVIGILHSILNIFSFGYDLGDGWLGRAQEIVQYAAYVVLAGIVIYIGTQLLGALGRALPFFIIR